jgi:hypothetical protein
MNMYHKKNRIFSKFSIGEMALSVFTISILSSVMISHSVNAASANSVHQAHSWQEKN